MSKLLLHLKIWRENPELPGHFEDYTARDIPESASFLEMLDIVNSEIIEAGKDPVAFDHDCREGICGMCSLVINGIAHGPKRAVTTCQLHMRSFSNEDTIWIEPFRVAAFPVIKDLVVDRSAFDRIQQAGGYVSIRTGAAPDANAIPIDKATADDAFDSAACIGCGACAAACKNGSPMLFVAAKVNQLNSLPQGVPQQTSRVVAMTQSMNAEGFGGCTNQFECSAVCPKEISVANIARLNREFVKASLKSAVAPSAGSESVCHSQE